ncbi:MAG TPA: dCTP deaminase [Chitinivibrionales bacterium]|nr:dCTP deaminase [Chitinivibrionales bacterium]
MILTRDVIRERLRTGELRINPFNPRSVGPASIDLSLDKQIRVFNGRPVSIIDELTNYKSITRLVDITKGYILKPGVLVLGITKETVTLPGNICGWINSRSRFARIGLMSHIAAPFISPGVSNKQVLEIFNAGIHPINLVPGVKICHLVLQECKGSAIYKGKFRKQTL